MSIRLPDDDPHGQLVPSTDGPGGDGGVHIEERVGFLRAELDRQQQRFACRRRRDKRKSFALQMATVALSATITVLLGLRVGGGCSAPWPTWRWGWGRW